MFQLVSLLVLISAIFHMISVRKKAKIGQVADELKGSEKTYIWIASFLNPVFSGAVFYYGWKSMLPNKAKKANAISLWAFFILAILLILLMVVLPESAQVQS